MYHVIMEKISLMSKIKVDENETFCNYRNTNWDWNNVPLEYVYAY